MVILLEDGFIFIGRVEVVMIIYNYEVYCIYDVILFCRDWLFILLNFWCLLVCYMYRRGDCIKIV